MSGIVIPWLGYSLMGLGVVLLLIPFWPAIRKRISKQDNTKPNVIYETTDPVIMDGIYYLRLVLRNKVKNPIDESISKATKARIIIYKAGKQKDAWDGRWADTNPPNSYGDIQEKNKLDINPNDIAKLDIGARAIGHNQFKGHHNRHHESPEPQRKILDPGKYLLMVAVWAIHMPRREMYFTLRIPKIVQNETLKQVSVKHIKTLIVDTGDYLN